MADFIASSNRNLQAENLLGLLKRPYGAAAPGGWTLPRPWGTLALLRDRLAQGRNLLTEQDWALAWVGDLHLSGGPSRLQAFLKNLSVSANAAQGCHGFQQTLRGGQILDDLNGAFALVIVGPQLICVLTDPMGSVQVYMGRNADGQFISIGTHPDLVAATLDGEAVIEPVSVCDFINTGTPCSPFTMYRDVVELAPGTIHTFWPPAGPELDHKQSTYWTPASEIKKPHEVSELSGEFVKRWQRAVSARCQGDNLAVLLSGGLDSRLVLSCIPSTQPCVALTLCDTINREVRLAREVAHCYGRQWLPLYRDPEYTGQTALAATRLTGCEGEWHHAHTIGFVERLEELGIDSVLTGLLMDNNFKGYYARDVRRVNRGGGLLPARFQIISLDYIDQVHPFCRTRLNPDCVAGTIERRRAFTEDHFARRRKSSWEWLDGYPYSQASDNTGWIVERRLMPLRLPVMDRAMLDLAFQIPMQFKAGGRFFEQAAAQLLGPGRAIPNANDGVRPGSRHAVRLIQRAGRKLENAGRDLLRRTGIRLPVPTSWHDYPLYWRTSTVLETMRAEHGPNLHAFQGTVFQSDPTVFLHQLDLPWEIGSRLIQLALWQSIIREYRLQTGPAVAA